jgi:gluconolactonase
MMMKTKALFAGIVCGMLLSSTAGADTPQRVTGLKTPESVVAGADGRIYVSEIGEFGKDGDGQISIIGVDGKATVFASGMDDPKGLAFHLDILYVADKTRVLKVAPNGKWSVFAAAEAFPAAPQFLNDLVADGLGNLYITDSGDLKGKGGAVYRINKNGKVALIVNGEKDARIQAPNGLLMGGKGTLLEVDFASGILYRIKVKSGEMEKIAEGFGGGDGIVRAASGTLYVSDWKNGLVFSIGKQGGVSEFGDGFVAAADIGLSHDGQYILVPDMKAGELVWLPLDSR